MNPAPSIPQAYERGLDLLRRAAGPAGFLASPHDRANYQRVWARDGVITGLAALVSGDSQLVQTFARTLETLAGQQGPHGEIPSNVQTDDQGRVTDVSYGGLVGRADAPAWFVIGVTSLARVTGDHTFLDAMAVPMERALALLCSWEFNGRGLVYVPEGGSWADEYVMSGYELGVQLLRLWALRGHARVMNHEPSARKAETLAELVRINYWPQRDMAGSALVRHPVAYDAVLARGEPTFWLSTLRPGGYERGFDALANALAMLLKIPTPAQNLALVQHTAAMSAHLGCDLVPAFWPPIREQDPRWDALMTHHRGEFRNRPYEYHNGGLWPMVNGFWGLGLVAAGMTERAARVARSMDELNRSHAEAGREWGFFEFGHAQSRVPMGVCECTWSAAATILLHGALAGAPLPWMF